MFCIYLEKTVPEIQLACWDITGVGHSTQVAEEQNCLPPGLVVVAAHTTAVKGEHSKYANNINN